MATRLKRVLTPFAFAGAIVLASCGERSQTSAPPALSTLASSVSSVPADGTSSSSAAQAPAVAEPPYVLALRLERWRDAARLIDELDPKLKETPELRFVRARVANALECQPSDVFVASTGVIGVPLPIDKAEAGIDAVLLAETADWQTAAVTIGTTDTFPKAAVTRAVVDGKTVSLVGIVKGSGMIAPDMATMLGFIFTDAAIAAPLLQTMLSAANRATFSCITVDSDTSTSDTVLAFATGAAGNTELTSFDRPGADAFQAALTDLCRQLAHLVVRDGEGASKFITVAVDGAVSDESAHRVAMSIANSPLVKTAIAGEDANWGRVVMAVGKAGEPAERDKLSIRFGGIQVASNGYAVAGYDEAPIAAHLKGQEIEIGVDLCLGDGRATVWTCDLTHGYISINADYRS